MWILRLSQLVLKSPRTRKRFQTLLVQNLRRALGHVKIKIEGSRFLLEEGNKAVFSRTFGLSSFSPAEKVKARELEEKVIERLKGVRSFAVRVKRLEKKGKSSQEWERELGAVVGRKLGIKVDLENPERTVWIELKGRDAWVYTERFKGPGGFPVGVQGKVAILIRNRRDLLAGWLMMRKGCWPYPVYFKLKDVGQRFFRKWLFQEPEWISGRELEDAFKLGIPVAVGDMRIKSYPKPVLRPLLFF